MKRPEVIAALRSLAAKYAEVGDYVQAEQRSIRAEQLAVWHIQNPMNFETLYNKVSQCDIKARKYNITDADRQEILEVMTEAVKIANHLFGARSIVTG